MSHNKLGDPCFLRSLQWTHASSPTSPHLIDPHLHARRCQIGQVDPRKFSKQKLRASSNVSHVFYEARLLRPPAALSHVMAHKCFSGQHPV